MRRCSAFAGLFVDYCRPFLEPFLQGDRNDLIAAAGEHASPARSTFAANPITSLGPREFLDLPVAIFPEIEPAATAGDHSQRESVSHRNDRRCQCGDDLAALYREPELAFAGGKPMRQFDRSNLT